MAWKLKKAYLNVAFECDDSELPLEEIYKLVARLFRSSAADLNKRIAGKEFDEPDHIDVYYSGDMSDIGLLAERLIIDWQRYSEIEGVRAIFHIGSEPVTGIELPLYME